MNSFSTDSFAEKYTACDFCVQDGLLDNAGEKNKNVNAVDSAFFDELAKQSGVERVGNLYLNHENHIFSQKVWSDIEKYFFSDELVKMQIESLYAGDGFTVNSYLKDISSKRTMEGNTYGMSKLTVEKLYDVQTVDGTTSVDWEKFSSGNYVLAERWQYANDGFLNIVNPGDVVEIGGREYTVYGLVDIPLIIEYPVYAPIECNFILPEEEYLSIYGEVAPMRTLIDVADDEEAVFEEWIKGYTAGSNLNYTSKQSVIEDNKAFGDLFAIAAILVAVILGIIGVMNFSNTMIASIIVRSRELAMLEAIGMTARQQKKSLIREGMKYFAYTSILTIAMSTIVNVTAVKTFVNNLPMFSWRFSLTSLVICLPVILIIILLVPTFTYKRLRRRSVVERLRFTE